MSYDLASFVPASLTEVRPCPARAEYIELCFSTPQGEWEWCFPKPPPARRRPLRPLALRLGTYGVQAHLVRDDGLGLSLQSSAALPMILAGAPIHVERRLLRTVEPLSTSGGLRGQAKSAGTA